MMSCAIISVCERRVGRFGAAVRCVLAASVSKVCLSECLGPAIRISPDGKKIVYMVRRGKQSLLLLRLAECRPMDGTR